MANQPGVAYAFFKCRADQRTIAHEIPDIRRMTKTPPQIELKLTSLREFRGDEEIVSIARQAMDEGMNYSLTLLYPGKNNLEAAVELKTIIVQMYQSPLYFKGESFQGGIGYKEGEHYVELD